MVEFYVAILAANSEGEIFATVPDLPGANSAAATRGEALRLVTEFADDYVRDLIEDGHPVPPARSIDEIEVDPEDDELGRALIPVEIPGKSVKVTISIDEAVLKRVDQAAGQVGESRSGYFASAAILRMRGASIVGGNAAGSMGVTLSPQGTFSTQSQAKSSALSTTSFVSGTVALGVGVGVEISGPGGSKKKV